MEKINKLLNFLTEQPNDCFLRHALALEYVKIQNDEMALESFKTLLSVDENYIGSYYHLAKLYERQNNIPLAIATYKKGIEIATKLKDNHARNELQMSLDDWED